MELTQEETRLTYPAKAFADFYNGTKPQVIIETFLRPRHQASQSLIFACYWLMRYEAPPPETIEQWYNEIRKLNIKIPDAEDFSQLFLELKATQLLNVLTTKVGELISKENLRSIYAVGKKSENLHLRLLCASRLQTFKYPFEAAHIYFTIATNKNAFAILKNFVITALIALLEEENYAKTCFAKVISDKKLDQRIEDYKPALKLMTNLNLEKPKNDIIDELLISAIVSGRKPDANAVYTLARLHASINNPDNRERSPETGMKILLDNILKTFPGTQKKVFDGPSRKKFQDVMLEIASKHKNIPKVLYYLAQFYIIENDIENAYACIMKIKDDVDIHPELLIELAENIHQSPRYNMTNKEEYYRTLMELAVHFGSIKASFSLGEHYFRKQQVFEAMRIYAFATKIAYIKCEAQDYELALKGLKAVMKEVHPYLYNEHRLKELTELNELELNEDLGETCSLLDQLPDKTAEKKIRQSFTSKKPEEIQKSLDLLISDYQAINTVTLLCRDYNINTENFNEAFKELGKIVNDAQDVLELVNQPDKFQSYVKKNNLLALFFSLKSNPDIVNTNQCQSLIAKGLCPSKLVHLFALANKTTSDGSLKYPFLPELFTMMIQPDFQKLMPEDKDHLKIVINIYHCLLHINDNTQYQLKDLKEQDPKMFKSCTKILNQIFLTTPIQRRLIESTTPFVMKNQREERSLSTPRTLGESFALFDKYTKRPEKEERKPLISKARKASIEPLEEVKSAHSSRHSRRSDSDSSLPRSNSFSGGILSRFQKHQGKKSPSVNIVQDPQSKSPNTQGEDDSQRAAIFKQSFSPSNKDDQSIGSPKRWF